MNCKDGIGTGSGTCRPRKRLKESEDVGFVPGVRSSVPSGVPAVPSGVSEELAGLPLDTLELARRHNYLLKQALQRSHQRVEVLQADLASAARRCTTLEGLVSSSGAESGSRPAEPTEQTTDRGGDETDRAATIEIARLNDRLVECQRRCKEAEVEQTRLSHQVGLLNSSELGRLRNDQCKDEPTRARSTQKEEPRDELNETVERLKLQLTAKDSQVRATSVYKEVQADAESLRSALLRECSARDALAAELRVEESLEDEQLNDIIREDACRRAALIESVKVAAQDAESCQREREAALGMLEEERAKVEGLQQRVATAEFGKELSHRKLGRQRLTNNLLKAAASAITDKLNRAKVEREQLLSIVKKQEQECSGLRVAIGVAGHDAVPLATTDVHAELLRMQQQNAELERMAIEFADLKKEHDILKNQHDALTAEVEEVSVAFEERQQECDRLAEVVLRDDDASLQVLSERLKAKQVVAHYNAMTTGLEDKLRMQGDELARRRAADGGTTGAIDICHKSKATAEHELQVANAECQKHCVELETAKREVASEFKLPTRNLQISPFVLQLCDVKHHLQFSRELLKAVGCDKTEKTLEIVRPEGDSSDAPYLLKENAVLRKRLSCPLCHEHMKDSFLQRCGHVFCRGCLEKSLTTRNRKCPQCKFQYHQGDIKRIFFE